MKKRIIGLDSLKCLAIILIIIYHCFPKFLTGGFIAVEIFFAISGFLIGSKFIRENKNEETKSSIKNFFRFFFVRLKKFLPGLVFCMIITLSLAFFANPDLSARLRQNSLYAITFSTNIASILSNASYESSIIPNLFNHTWFLALELQVCLIAYIVFGVAAAKTKKQYTRLGVGCVIIGFLSFLLMGIYGKRFGLFDRAYFGPDTHIGAFFFGAAIAAFSEAREKFGSPAKKKWLAIIVLSTAIIGTIIMTPFVKYNSAETFVIALPTAAVLSCAMIVATLKLQTEKEVKILRPVEYIGRISFYLYLLHWPLNILLEDLLKDFIAMEIIPFIAIALSFGLAILADKVIMPLFSKHRKVGAVIMAASLILPIMALVRAPRISALEESLSQKNEMAEEEKVEESEEKFVVDYTGIEELGKSIETEILPNFNAATNFAKVYVVPKVSLGYASGSGFVAAYYRGNGTGRTAYTTPDLSANSLAAIKRLNVMVVGDSVAHGAKNELARRGYFVDAVGSRDMLDGINLIAGYRAATGGILPRIIVISLVANYASFSANTLQTLVDTAGPGHTFIFLTGSCRQYSREAQNNAIRELGRRNGNVKVLDWEAYAASHPEYISDGLHLTAAGRTAYANFIATAVGY